MKSKKHLIVIILLMVAILLGYSLPKAKYTGTGFISRLRIPEIMSGWMGKDVTKDVGLSVRSTEYDFVSEALAYNYVNKEGKNLLFIVLDAGNFHHPKVCFTGAGFKIKELADTEFQLPNRALKSHTLFTERGKDNFLSFYWIVIDKNVAHEWIEQKSKQLIFSLFGSKRVGLMVRVDVPAKVEDIDDATDLAKQFINELSVVLPPDQADYIFGE
ncbi:MAG: EpsI family protein [Nitrospirae bacterium]|nr:EpsI family protein [Nitrospirota bacterium]